MSLYGVHKVCYLVQMDLAFRQRLAEDPAGALKDLPLSDEERRAFLERDMAALYRMGAHTFLMSRLPRFGAMGLSREEYIERMSGQTR